MASSQTSAICGSGKEAEEPAERVVVVVDQVRAAGRADRVQGVLVRDRVLQVLLGMYILLNSVRFGVERVRTETVEVKVEGEMESELEVVLQ